MKRPVLRRRRRAGHHERTHHLVVLVLDDVAVPHVEAFEIESGSHRRDLTGIGDHRVLVAALPGLDARTGVGGLPDEPAFDHLETDEVEVDRVRVLGEVVDLPVLDVADDGAGLDVESIRRKAFEKGLLNADSKVTDDAIMQLILTPGFSTADKVTQTAGRGVGMDVVANEIKQLGGSLQISSVTDLYSGRHIA